MNRVRIFISSPGDVAEERTRAQTVVEQLQKEFAEVLELEALLWEHEPLLASADFQTQIRSPADFDIFATIIGARLGSPLGGHFTRADGSPYASGTEFEFEIALNSFHAKGAPELLVYRKRPPPTLSDPEQADLVDRFFKKWFMDERDNTATGAYHWFAQATDFEAVFTLHLRKLLRRFLPRPNNIPAPISNFVGRRQLVQEITREILQPDTRLLALVGAGGCGKSRLALRIARDVLPEFIDGVFFVPLVNVGDANLIPNAIGAAMSVKETEGGDSLTNLLKELADKNLLLILDNLEQISGAGAMLNKMLQNCAALKIVATSSTNIRITGGKSMAIPPLALPAHRQVTLADAQRSDAVQLFVERAQEARADFILDATNCQQVVDLCRSLDALPLAIELASSRLRSMDLARLAKAMDKRFAVLKGGADDLLDHQKSLRELVLWSYQLLNDEQQKLWRRMAVFASSFSMEAAEGVCDPDDEFIVDVEVEELADHSLATITFAPTARIQMLGTLREFALQELKAVGEYDTYHNRLVDWACTCSIAAHAALHDVNVDQTLQQMDLEHDNLLAAIDYCDLHDDPRALQIASGVWYHWFERGYLSMAHTHLQRALDDTTAQPLVRARALKGLGSVARFQNDLDLASRSCQLALELYQSIGDMDGKADALGEIGAIYISLSKLPAAVESLDKAIEIRSDQEPNERHLSFLLATRGVIDHLEGNLDEAKTYYQQALDIGAHTGDLDSRASALVNMGEIAEAEMDVPAAYTYYRDSLQLFYERGKKVAIAYSTEVLAGLSAKHLEHPQHAALLFGFADALRRETNNPIEPFNKQRLTDDIKLTQNMLGEQVFDQQWGNGTDLHLEDFLSYMQAHEINVD